MLHNVLTRLSRTVLSAQQGHFFTSTGVSGIADQAATLRKKIAGCSQPLRLRLESRRLERIWKKYPRIQNSLAAAPLEISQLRYEEVAAWFFIKVVVFMRAEIRAA